MPLSKRRRLFTPKKHKARSDSKEQDDPKDKEVATARGRLKGALMVVLEPQAEESDSSSEPSTPNKRQLSIADPKDTSSEDEQKSSKRQSYVLKLFDRSVDLSQFSEDSPLYPICRAWIRNQPKAIYKDFDKEEPEPQASCESIDLPGPKGPPISRIPELIPEQKKCSKDNIDLNYSDALPSRAQLLQSHMARWASVRGAWLERAARVEARYEDSQDILNKINVNST